MKMLYCVVFIVVFCSHYIHGALISDPEPGVEIDICQLDHVTLQCGRAQVIVITSARYGRMRANQCVGDRQLGCASDVLGWADRWCSGRNTCFIDEGFQTNLANMYTCDQGNQDLTNYLEIVYTCVDVIIPTSSRCRSNGKPPGILKARDGVISSHVTRETGCGAMGSPWEIRAPRDAVIRLHVLDFFWFFNNGPICGNRYLEIADVDAESARSPTQLCSQTERRSEPIIFDTSAIRIWISPPAQGEFLLYYSVLTDSKEIRMALSSDTSHMQPTLTLVSLVLVLVLVLKT